MTQETLKNAFRYHMRNCRPPFWHTQGYRGMQKGAGIAKEAIRRARQDVAENVPRYPAPVKPYAPTTKQTDGFLYVENPESVGLRYVGRVNAEPGGRNGYFDKRESSGWYTDPYSDVFKDGSGLCWGVVYQLTGRDGKARFVPGYQMGGVDAGPVLDFSRVYECDPEDSYWVYYGDKDDIPAMRDVCRAADSMAQSAAESEREYQTAWQAGSKWADAGEQISAARLEILAILKERKEILRTYHASGPMSCRAICDTLKSRVRSLLSEIQQARTERDNLAQGDAENLWFWSGDEHLQAAFCDGAGVSKFPNS